jgi:hypothetical protein
MLIIIETNLAIVIPNGYVSAEPIKKLMKYLIAVGVVILVSCKLPITSSKTGKVHVEYYKRFDFVTFKLSEPRDNLPGTRPFVKVYKQEDKVKKIEIYVFNNKTVRKYFVPLDTPYEAYASETKTEQGVTQDTIFKSDNAIYEIRSWKTGKKGRIGGQEILIYEPIEADSFNLFMRYFAVTQELQGLPVTTDRITEIKGRLDTLMKKFDNYRVSWRGGQLRLYCQRTRYGPCNVAAGIRTYSPSSSLYLAMLKHDYWGGLE